MCATVLALVACAAPATTPSSSSSPVSLPATPVVTASPTPPAPSPTAGVLDGRFGLVVYGGSGLNPQSSRAIGRSETSDAELSSFEPQGRSWTSLSRAVSPDGKLVAYWGPVNNGPVLHVRPVTGGADRAVFTGGAEMFGNAFTWSSDGTGLVAAIDNDCEEICGAQGGRSIAELWTIDLGNGKAEKIASGKFWIPVAWDRATKLVAAGVTGPGGYLGGYDVIDLQRQPYPVRSSGINPAVIGRLKASSDARYVLLDVDSGTSTSLAWWPLAQFDRRTTVEFDGLAAEWRPGTSEVWWVSGLTPAGCRARPCAGTQLISFDVATRARSTPFRGPVGATLAGFRADGSAAITSSDASTAGTNASELTLVEVASGRSAQISLSGVFGGSVRLR